MSIRSCLLHESGPKRSTWKFDSDVPASVPSALRPTALVTRPDRNMKIRGRPIAASVWPTTDSSNDDAMMIHAVYSPVWQYDVYRKAAPTGVYRLL